MQIEIAEKKIGAGFPCYIIAEAGVNHNGDLAIAKSLIHEASKSGADCVKFQTFKAERVVTQSAPKANYQLGTTDPNEAQIDMLKSLELKEEYYSELINLCKEYRIDFLSTPYNIEDIVFLEEHGVSAYKVASALLVEPSFLKALSLTGKPIILSTGMATLAEVDEAVGVIMREGNQQIVLLQCSTDYPSAVKHANLRAMQTMQNSFGFPIGYSDHTQDSTSCIAAVALGAKVIEKHFTLDKNLVGPDQSTSADPIEFKSLVKYIRDTESALGDYKKVPNKAEIRNKVGMRRSIVARYPIPSGTIIVPELLTYKRPATGILPKEEDLLCGSVARFDIDADQTLEWWMFEKNRD